MAHPLADSHLADPPAFLRFEMLVKKLLTLRSFDLLEKSPVRVDALANKDGERWVIEIKYYRTARAQSVLLDAAAATLLNAARLLEAQRAMLVVSCVLPPAVLESFENRFGLTLIDRSGVFAWIAANAPEMSDELEGSFFLRSAVWVPRLTWFELGVLWRTTVADFRIGLGLFSHWFAQLLSPRPSHQKSCRYSHVRLVHRYSVPSA
jgi:hypothetical protein